MTTIDYPQLYIGGTWTAPAGHDTIEVHSPATEERIGSVPRRHRGRYRRRRCSSQDSVRSRRRMGDLGTEGPR